MHIQHCLHDGLDDSGFSLDLTPLFPPHWRAMGAHLVDHLSGGQDSSGSFDSRPSTYDKQLSTTAAWTGFCYNQVDMAKEYAKDRSPDFSNRIERVAIVGVRFYLTRIDISDLDRLEARLENT